MRRPSREPATDASIDGREVVQVSCPLCGGSEADTLFERHRFAYQRCRRCSLVRVNPQLTQGAIRRIYETGYEAKHGAHGAAPSATPDQVQILDTLSRLAGGVGRLLDVGCFEGAFLCGARELGWGVTGTETSHSAVSFARDVRKLDVRLGALEEASFPAESFDAVVLLDVVEHLPDPRRTLEEVYRVVRPGGAVYLWTPNFDSLTRRVAGRHWGAVVFPWHLHLFTADTLARAVEQVGFTTIHIGTRNWLLEFRDPYAALRDGRSLGPPPKIVRRFKRLLDNASRPFFAWADENKRHWGAQLGLYARRDGTP
jgi:2-polyprenyl-3-methyl-5-hydroxy-6-metoxy-1,4-benzoquinol methylase